MKFRIIQNVDEITHSYCNVLKHEKTTCFEQPVLCEVTNFLCFVSMFLPDTTAGQAWSRLYDMRSQVQSARIFPLAYRYAMMSDTQVLKLPRNNKENHSDKYKKMDPQI